MSAIANNVANAESEDYDRLGTEFQTTDGGGVEATTSATGEGVDLAAEMQGLSEAEAAYKANAAVFDAGADLWEMLSLIQRD